MKQGQKMYGKKGSLDDEITIMVGITISQVHSVLKYNAALFGILGFT